MTRLVPALLLTLACNLGIHTTTAGPDSTTTTSDTSGLSMSATSHAPTTTSSSTTTTDTTTTTQTSTGTDCDIFDCSHECDQFAQDCPEGQKCMPWSNDGSNAWNATKCVDVMPNPDEPGEPCTVEGGPASGIDSCDKAAMCWNVDPDTGKGTCFALCGGSWRSPTCPPGFRCIIGGGDAPLNLCVSSCNPLAQGCPNMELCIPEPMSDYFTCVPDASGDMGAQNDPCEAADACDPGLACVDPSLATECDPMAAGCCLPFCDLTMPDCTNQGAMCLAWYEVGTPPPGLEKVGVCGLMQ